MFAVRTVLDFPKEAEDEAFQTMAPEDEECLMLEQVSEGCQALVPGREGQQMWLMEYQLR